MRLYSWLCITGFCFVALNALGQVDSLARQLNMDLEIRPRVEYLDGFNNGSPGGMEENFYTTQRNRLSITYAAPRLKLHGSFQEIHLWGEDRRVSSIGSINAFELYAEPSVGKNLKLRIGRQAISLDNGRIFSAAPWGQQSRSHEGIRLLYKKKLETDLIMAFTRPYYEPFDKAYSPVAAHQYKYLFVHHLKTKLGAGFTLTTINAADIFREKDNGRGYFGRITNGGRLDWAAGPFSVTISGYYQHGRVRAAKSIRAWYLQPELALTANQYLVRLGMELLSGDNPTTPANHDHSFVPLYGVAWKFMGNMNLFARFPADVGNRGLANPYLFLIRRFSQKLSVRLDGHLFYSQHPLMDSMGLAQSSYLGWETDASFNYKPSTQFDINFGLSAFLPQRSTALLGKISNPSAAAVWSYLMIAWHPRLLERRW